MKLIKQLLLSTLSKNSTVRHTQQPDKALTKTNPQVEIDKKNYYCTSEQAFGRHDYDNKSENLN